MKRRKLEKHLRDHGCFLHHHGARHDVWVNPANDPRHDQIKCATARGICQILGIPRPAGI